mgnify:FL=1
MSEATRGALAPTPSDRADLGARCEAPREDVRTEARRAAVVGVDLARLAHELRTPLAAIQSTADALASGHLGAIDPRHAAYLASIRETARHALSVIGGMVDASAPALSAPLDLRGIVTEVTGGLAMLAAAARITLVVETACGDVRATGSPTDVRQMLINLVSNGISHAGAGATVRVAVGGDGLSEVWLDVTDDGPGLPAGILHRLEAAALLDPAPGGARSTRARLGLRLTRQLAAANGGRLELASSPSGTRARIVLPAL